MQQTDIYYPTLKHFIVVFPLYIVIRIWQSTVRLVTDEESLKLMSSPARIIGIAWHSRIFFLAMCKYYYRDKFPMAGLVSASKDGAYLAAFFKLMGIGTVRGSSKRRGVGAIMALINALKDGSDVFITPDGPRGPKEIAKPGFLTVAKESGERIVALRITPRRYFTVPKSWDSFALPLPFTKIDVKARCYENYEAVCRDASNAGVSPEKLVSDYLNSSDD